MTPRLLRPLVVGIILTVLVWSSWRLAPEKLTLDTMRSLVNAHAPYGSLVFMVMVVIGIFSRVPMAGTLLIAAGSVLLGGFEAFAYGWAAALVGTTGTFLVVRYVVRDYLQQAVYGFSIRLRRLDERLIRNGFRVVFALRLVLGLAPVLNWGLGVTSVQTRHYVAGTALGILPNIAVAVLFADAIANRRSGGAALWSRLAIGATLLMAFAAIVTVIRRLVMERQRSSDSQSAGSEKSAQRPNYGVDAPFVRRRLLLVGVGALAVRFRQHSG